MGRGEPIGSVRERVREGVPITEPHDRARGGEWWLASDGQWYPPETHPDHRTSPPSWQPPQTPSAPPVVGPAAKPYRSPARLGRVLQVVLVLLTMLGAVALGSSVAEYLTIGRLIDDPLSVTVADVQASDDRQMVLWWTQLAAVAVVALVFIAWTYRLYRNLPALGVRPRFAPGWAIGGWFVPIMGLWRPKQIIDDIWRGTAPERSTPGGKVAVSPLVHLWWAVYLAGIVLYRSGMSQNDTSWGSLRTESLLTVAADAMFVLGSILAFWVVSQLTRRQERAASSRAGAAVAEPGASPVMAEHPTPVVSSRALPKWFAAVALPIAAVVVAGFAAVAWDPGRSEGVSESGGAIELGVGTLLEDVEAGDCFNLPADDEVLSEDSQLMMALEVVPCGLPHYGEVVARTHLPASTDSYPGEEEVLLTGLDRCRPPIERYVGASLTASGLGLFVNFPTADTWRAGDREFICSVKSLSGQPLNGSVEDTGGILASDQKTVFNLAEGDCFDDPASPDAMVLELVDCAAPHDNEVFAVVDFPAGPISAFPGEDELEEFANQTSAEEFERRVDPAVRDDLAYFNAWPSPGTWELGDRSVVVTLYDRNLHKLEGSMLLTIPASLNRGDCFDVPDIVASVTAVEIVSCDSLHDGEVVAVTKAPATIDFPGTDEVRPLGLSVCVDPFEQYVGATPMQSGLKLDVFSPTAEDWQAGNREFICYVTSGFRDPLQTSVEGTGETIEQ